MSQRCLVIAGAVNNLRAMIFTNFLSIAVIEMNMTVQQQPRLEEPYKPAECLNPNMTRICQIAQFIRRSMCYKYINIPTITKFIEYQPRKHLQQGSIDFPLPILEYTAIIPDRPLESTNKDAVNFINFQMKIIRKQKAYFL